MARYPRLPVKSTLETLEVNKVKLSVNVDESEFDKDIDAAFRKIAREVRLPGFRAGKAPRRVLEARIGVAPAREQALRDSIPVYLAKAVREHCANVRSESFVPPAFDLSAEAAGGRVSLRMLSIDTAYTLGRLAEARDQLLRALAASGLLRRQASLRLPTLPLRVGQRRLLGEGRG